MCGRVPQSEAEQLCLRAVAMETGVEGRLQVWSGLRKTAEERNQGERPEVSWGREGGHGLHGGQ